ncbi:MAG: hypothetical protein MZU97_02265 [Bacillus subtilis]|nr:hypothetical protein [Bacillus subtilis]
MKAEDGDIVEAGTEIAPGIVAKEKSMITVVSSAQFGVPEFEEIEDIDEEFEAEIEPKEEKVDILLRPVQEFEIKPQRSFNKIHFNRG